MINTNYKNNDRIIGLYGALLKRILDVVMSILFLPLFIFFTMVIAILIKADSSGPVFYLHDRIGYKKKTFRIYKFRTMSMGAEEEFQGLIKNSEHKESWDKYRKIRKDPRITRVGYFLRRWSLDELPQIINVLKGDMSLVGPRPISELPSELGIYCKNAQEYFTVRPGITGLWQVSGRNKLSFNKRMQLDIFYISHWSLWLDLVILLKTAGAIFDTEGAG